MFKVGDRVVVTTKKYTREYGKRGKIIDPGDTPLPEDKGYLVDHDNKPDESYEYAENELISEEIWDSPLYKLLREEIVATED